MEQNFNQNQYLNQNMNNDNTSLNSQVEQPVNPLILPQSQNNKGGAEPFDTKQYKEDLQNLKAQYDQSLNASAPSAMQDNNNGNLAMENVNNNNKDTATIVTVQVPVAVPIEVPVAVQVPVAVPVPVYVPVAVPENTNIESELKRQPKMEALPQMDSLPQMEALPQTSNNNNLYTPDIAQNTTNTQENLDFSSTTNENKSNLGNENKDNELLSRNSLDLTDFKHNLQENINVGIEKAKDAYQNIFKPSVENLLPENQQIEKKPQSAIFNEAKQPLVSQPLDEIDKKPVSEIHNNNMNTNENIPSDFIPNEMHDIKKEHKEINLNKQSSLMDNIKDTLNSGIETVKNNLGMNKKSEEVLIDQDKELLMKQPLEKEDRKEVLSMNINKEENLSRNENRLEQPLEQQSLQQQSEQPQEFKYTEENIEEMKEQLNKEFKEVKQSEINESLEKENAIISSDNLNLNVNQNNLQSDNSSLIENPGCRKLDYNFDTSGVIDQQELVPLINVNNRNEQSMYDGGNIHELKQKRSYADIVGNIDKQANKDVSSRLITSGNADSNTYSEAVVTNKRDEQQLEATKENIPSQNDEAPQIDTV